MESISVVQTSGINKKVRKMPEQRKQLVIKRKFQQSMILEVLLITFILINLIVIAGYFIIDSFADIQKLKLYLGYAVASLEIVGFFVVYRINLKASHRIAGPIYRFQEVLNAIEVGDLGTEVQIRDKDEFPEVAEQFNKTLKQLRQHINDAQHLAKNLQDAGGTDQELIKKLTEELAYFRTDQPKVSGEESES
jgi:methyl-accepting chemotaxis protein